MKYRNYICLLCISLFLLMELTALSQIQPVVSTPLPTFFYANYHIARDIEGNLYVPVQNSAAVYKLSPTSTIIPSEPFFTTQSPLMGGIAIDNNGNIYVTTGGNTIEKYTLGSGAVTSTTFYSNPPNSTVLDLPYGIDVDNVGNLFIASSGNKAIVKITPSAVATTIYKGNLLTQPVFVLIDNDGQLLVSDYDPTGNGKIVKVSQCGTVRTIIPATAGLNSPNGLVRTTSGNLYIADAGSNYIYQVQFDEPTTLRPYNGTHGSIYNYTDIIPLNEALLNEPIWMSLTADGSMFVTENKSTWNPVLQNGYRHGSIRKITGTGEYPIARGTVALSGVGVVTSLLRMQEALVNDGSITEKRNIDLACDTWATLPNGTTNFIEGQHYLASGIPPGLNLVLKRISGTRLEVSFTGKAQNHLKVHSNTITISFLNPAVVSNNGSQLQGGPTRLSVVFNDPVTATYSDTTFVETIANDGSFAVKQTITLSNKEWAYPPGTVLNEGSAYDFTVTNKPAELAMVITIQSSTTAEIEFVGNAINHAKNNSKVLTLSFTNNALLGGNVTYVQGLNGKKLKLDFKDPYTATYSTKIFNESIANDGSVLTTGIITLFGGLTWMPNGDFLSEEGGNNGDFSVLNVPPGLTVKITRLTTTTAQVSFIGNATPHDFANYDVPIGFYDRAVNIGNANNINGLNIDASGNATMLRVNFKDPYTAIYSGTIFAEATANDGSITATRTITLTGGDTWVPSSTFTINQDFFVNNLPAGLNITITRTSPTVAVIAFTGAAVAHQNLNDASIDLIFTNSAVASANSSGVVGLTPKTLLLDYNDNPTATYASTVFQEALPVNNGTITTTHTITLVRAQWTNSVANGSALVSGTHFAASGVPAGLTMTITRISQTVAQIGFLGSATNHENINDASVTLTFLSAALQGGNIAGTMGLTPKILYVDFEDSLLPPSSPNILDFTPQIGTTGTVVTISGFGFTGTRNVLFGGTPVSSFTVVSDSVVTAVVENGSTGDVTIVTANGLGILPGFTYVPRPTISSFTPTSGNQGQVVTINGANFSGTALNGTNWTTTSVYFGGTPASSFTVISSTQIQATVAAGASGAVRVETLPGNVGIRNGFCYMPPTITAFSPTSASTGTQVVITGSNFTGATAVRFNGRAAASFAVVSDTEIRAFPAANTPLTGNISVTTPQCTDDLATFTFIPAPVIYGFWLSGGTNGDVITIDGINFENASAVKFGDTVAASYTIVSPTRITAVVGHGKTGAVSVIGPGGVGARSKFIYYAPGAGRPNPPIITSFSPTEGPDGTVVTIDGLNFQGADWFTTAVRIGDATDGPRTAIIQSMTATRLVVKVNGGATGLIRVYTPAGVTTSTQTFTYFPPPTITAFSPTTGGAGTTVTILGTEFNGVSAVRIGGVAVSSYTLNSPTQITAIVGSGASGRVTVVANGGTATSASNFTFPTPPPAPTITSFTPALATSGTVITINGSNFTGATQVSFGGTPAQSFTVVNASRITALVGAGASGSIAVTTPSGTASKTGFTYLVNPLPTITSFSPASAAVGQTVTILGTYFTGATQVFMGSASVPFTVYHSGRITVEVPANAASGVIRVVTPNGVALRSGFTVISALAFLDKGNSSLTSEQNTSQQQTIAGVADVMSNDVGSIGLYPNPASDVVTLTVTGLAEQHSVKVIVVNNLGQTVMMLDKQPVGGILQMRLDVHNLPTGAYSAVISSDVHKRSVHFVKR